MGLNLGLSVHVERDLVIKVTVRVRISTRLIVSCAGPVQGPRGLRGRRVRQEEAQQARAEGRARPASTDHLTESRRVATNVPRPAQLETEAETAAERLLEEIDANQG